MHDFSTPTTMNAIQKTMFGLLSAAVLTLGSCNIKPPVILPPLPLSDVEPYFNEATEVQTIDTSYYQVKDAEGNVIGTVLLSAPYSEPVKGYNGPTPLLIALDAKGCIKNVVLKDNHETPRFAERVAAGGLYQAWDGLTVDEALDKPVDAISGATYTSNGVKNSLVVRLEAYQRQLKKDYSATKPSFWQRLFMPKGR